MTARRLIPGAPPCRLAVLGDVHGNLTALDAVLAAVRAAGIVHGVLTGDLADRGSAPEECVARLRALDWPCAQGNTDRAAARRGALSPTTRSYLLGLPPAVHLRVGRAAVLVCHDPDEAARMAAAAGADCVVTGHTHRPRIRRDAGRLLVNPGSVGEGTPDDLHPTWAWLEATQDGLVAGLGRVELPLGAARVPRGRAAVSM